ncbi:MAG: hypothetical protein R3F40_01970 [Candidatus Competibacteraceae bacterium]
MTHHTKDTAGFYRTGRDDTERQLRFDRGTLLLEGVAELPAGLETWFCYDPRVDAYRAPANRYSDIIGPLKGNWPATAPRYQRRELELRAGDDTLSPSTGSTRGLAGGERMRVVVLPTGAGKTLVGFWRCAGRGATG